MAISKKIVGRYAPSPTGDLHLGNIRTALLAWLQVRSQGGKFLLRMEDLDVPRVVKGSAEQILLDLEWLGIDWDGPVVYQSQRTHLYEDALKALAKQGLIYPCYCSRKDIQQAVSAPHNQGAIYPGTCRNLSNAERIEKAKFKVPSLRVEVDGDLVDSCGDFVVKRADGLFAYQMAVVVDDLEQGVTHVLRGRDLLESTARQQYLASKLSPEPAQMEYTHVPLMLDEAGARLSKRDGSLSVAEYKAQGYCAEKLIGELAFSLGLVDSKEPVGLMGLLNNINERLDML